MTTEKTLTSSGFYVSQEAPIHSDNPVPTPHASPPDILRCAYMELIVTDLAASRVFYVDVLGLYVTEEDEHAVYLRSTEEFIHHNLVLRQGPIAAVAAFSYRVRTPFGGVKASGLGHEGGYRSIDFYTDQQAVHITLGAVHNPTFGKTEHHTETDLDDPDPR